MRRLEVWFRLNLQYLDMDLEPNLFLGLLLFLFETQVNVYSSS